MTIIFNDVFKGISVEGAIATVAGVTLAADHATMTFSVGYRSPAADVAETYDVECFSCLYHIDGSDIITQAYEYLVTMPKFSQTS